ncbi:NINE protein [Leisingera sp. S232]|uniref:NINE protein n=1 Tax=Leisingera sp. S232 TaxID=3415132 RepID=UPI0008694490|nr:hypothetical protein AB838_20065 [Rhodobacteraceae bacterium (ex Bugula neritina AB1)]
MIDEEKSSASYGTAVILCGLFGVIGVHHFYLRNYMHGMIDLGLFILFVVLLAGDQPLLGYLVLLVDIAHSIIVFYLLIAEKVRDGSGRLVKLK